MKTFLFHLLKLLTACLLAVGTAHAASGNTGKEFYFSFQPNYSNSGSLTLFVTGQQNTIGVVEISNGTFSQNFTVTANQVTSIAIPRAAMALPANSLSRLAVHVTAVDDVTVYGLNQESATTDAFLALPVDALGLQYKTLSYAATIGLPSQLVMVGAFDGTQVVVTSPVALNSHPANVPFTITLNRGDTYMLTTTADVTGTDLSASAPIAVMAGVQCVNIPAGASACDHIVEMMPPTSTWGKSFVTVPLATRRNGDVFRFLASENDTVITINGTVVATLQKNKFFETVLKTRSEIEASSPVLVAQYSPGSSFDGVTSDPFMMLIPPTAQFLNQYAFSTPATGFSANFVNVVVPSGEIGSLMLDGVLVNPTLFAPIGASGFSGAQIQISLGSHNLVSTSSVPFGIYVYGYASYDSYGYPGGMSFKAINPVGDPYLPNLRLVENGAQLQGTATDSEDINANGILDAGEDLNGNAQIDRRSEDLNADGILQAAEDLNGNGILDRDSGIFKVELLPGFSNLKLDVLPFVPGSLSAQFNITRENQSQPGLGTLHVEDGAGNQMDLPISIGAVPTFQNVRVISTLSTADIEVDVGSFVTAPYSVSDGVNQKIIEWRFDSFKADTLADLGFDVIFKNPVPAEKRLVSHKLDLLYTDANGKPVRTELGARYVDVYPSNFQITPATDKSTYLATDTILVTSLAKNLGISDGTVGLRLSVKDLNNVPVSVIGNLPAQVINANGTLTFAGLNFPADGKFAGRYKVLAELLDINGNVVAFGSAPFAIIASGEPNLKAGLTTDKQAYRPSESVRISDRLTNVSPNENLNDLTLVTALENPDGSIRWTKSEVLPQLALGNAKDYAYSVPLAMAVAGTYRATLTVVDSHGAQLAQSAASFEVRSTADTGTGLAGSISASPRVVNAGNAVEIRFDAANSGNAAFVGLPITVSVVNPATQQIVVEYPYSANIPVQASFSGTNNWVAAGSGGATYVAVLSADVGGVRIVLAQSNFTMIKLDVGQTSSGRNRVLALASCVNHSRDVDDEDDDDEEDGDDGDGDGDGDEDEGDGDEDGDDRDDEGCDDDDADDDEGGADGEDIDNDHDGDEGDDDGDDGDSVTDCDDDADENHHLVCAKARARAIHATLHQLNIAHYVTTKRSTFKRALRSGRYNTYWISGNQAKLYGSLAAEVREAVFSGNALILDATLSDPNLAVETAAGIHYVGVTSERNLAADIAGPIFSAQRLSTDGLASRLELRGATQQATLFSQSATAVGPGIVTYAYGQGRSLTFAPDLLKSIRKQPQWQGVLASGLQYAAPTVTSPFSPGAYTDVKTRIANLGAAVDVGVKTVLPQAAFYQGSSPVGTFDAGSNAIQWALNLSETQAKDLFLTIRVPITAGDFVAETSVRTTKDGISNPYGNPISLPIKVVAATQNAGNAINALNALTLPASTQRQLRSALVRKLQQAMWYFNQNTRTGYTSAIALLVQVGEQLSGLAPVNTDAVRLDVGRVLKEAQWRWTLTPPPPPSDDDD